MIRKITRPLIAIIILLLIALPVAADWSVTVNWTPSPNATREILLINDVEQICPTPATCNFSVVDLSNQSVTIRSFNIQESYIDYNGGNLIEAAPPNPASGAIIIITIIH